MMRHAILFAALALGGCASTGVPIVSEKGACGSFERPEYALRGRTAYDQRAADNFVESGVSACGWPRPAPRPPELERAPVLERRVPAAPAARPSLYQRAKARVIPKSRTSAQAPSPVPAVVERPPPEGAAAPMPAAVAPYSWPPAGVAPPPARRDPFDELMTPPQRVRRVL